MFRCSDLDRSDLQQCRGCEALIRVQITANLCIFSLAKVLLRNIRKTGRKEERKVSHCAMGFKPLV